MKLNQIKNLIARRKYRLTIHAETERDAEQITLHELEEALLSPEAEIIEDYSNDPRGHSCLMSGFTKDNPCIHIVLGVGDEEILVIITVYRPDPDEWIDCRTRKDRI